MRGKLERVPELGPSCQGYTYYTDNLIYCKDVEHKRRLIYT